MSDAAPNATSNITFVARLKKIFVHPKFLLYFGLAVSSAFIIEGFLCFSLCTANVHAYILSFYYILFGLLMLGAELKFKVIAKYFKVVESFFGKGLFYIILGTIAFGGEWWAILIGIFLIVNGIFNLVGGCTNPKSPTQLDQLPNSDGIKKSETEVAKVSSQNQTNSNAHDALEVKLDVALPPGSNFKNNAYEDY